jgi:hypothetical protein
MSASTQSEYRESLVQDCNGFKGDIASFEEKIENPTQNLPPSGVYEICLHLAMGRPVVLEAQDENVEDIKDFYGVLVNAIETTIVTKEMQNAVIYVNDPNAIDHTFVVFSIIPDNQEGAFQLLGLVDITVTEWAVYNTLRAEKEEFEKMLEYTEMRLKTFDDLCIVK